MNARKTMRAGVVALAMLACSSVTSAQQGVVKPKGFGRTQGPGLQGFNVVLVLGDLEAGAVTPDNVPVAARKALTDMKDFLPYKSYRLLDTMWILTAKDGPTSTMIRLRGPEERDYELALSSSPESPGSRALRMTFQLRGSGGEIASATPSIDHMRKAMERTAERRVGAAGESEGRRGPEPGGGPEAAARAENLKLTRQSLDILTAQTRQRVAESRKVIDTGFTMDLGETVVVGTSRVRGETALIALLTAVPRGKK